MNDTPMTSNTLPADAARRRWHRQFVEDVLPFLSSLAVHAVLIVLAVIAARVLVATISTPVVREQMVPTGGDFKTEVPGVIDGRAGQINGLLQKTLQDKYPDAADVGGTNTETGLNDALTTGGGQGEGDAADVIGVGHDGGAGAGTGFGIGLGTGGGKDGVLAAFGHRQEGGGNGLFQVGPTFGQSNPRRIAFVCDGSGSMVSKMASLKNELEKAVGGMKVVNEFNVVFFRDAGFAALSDGGLVRATPENKRKALQFLGDMTSTGTTNPIPGLELAFRQNPQLVYLLTDGDFPDNAAVVRKVNELNREKKARVNTIAFVSEQDTDREFLDVLQQIARENGGTFRHVRENDLHQ